MPGDRLRLEFNAMPKTWEKMTQAEKIEDLRHDVVRLFDAYNDLDRRLMAGGQVVGQHLGQLETSAKEGANKIRALEETLRTLSLEEVLGAAETLRAQSKST
jgi:hypothetical protein